MRISEKSIGLIRIDLDSKDPKAARAVIDQIIERADEPTIAIGRTRNGSAVLVFRSEKPWRNVPSIAGAEHNQRVFPLASSDGNVRLTINCDVESLDDSAYSWATKVEAEQLPTLPDVAGLGQKIIEAAFALGLTWASLVDQDTAREQRAAKLKADIAAGRVKIKTDEELQAERDAEIVRETAGREYSWTDGIAAQEILAARHRHAQRLRPTADATY
jgi:hypothetical protein